MTACNPGMKPATSSFQTQFPNRYATLLHWACQKSHCACQKVSECNRQSMSPSESHCAFQKVTEHVRKSLSTLESHQTQQKVTEHVRKWLWMSENHWGCQKVSETTVSHSSPGGESRVVDEVEELLGIADGHQPLHGQVEPQGLVFRGLIYWRRTETKTYWIILLF